MVPLDEILRINKRKETNLPALGPGERRERPGITDLQRTKTQKMEVNDQKM